MSHFHNNMLLGSAGNQGAYEIERSLRFNNDDSAYLSRTPSSAGDRKTWTWSGWVKRGQLGVYPTLFGAGGTSPAYDALRFLPSDKIQFYQQGATTTTLTTDATFRDVSAWYHVVLKLNSTASEAALFVNGVEQSWSGTQPTNTNGNINNNISHAVGAAALNSGFSGHFDGYLAEVHFIDGQALNASDFGETDEDTGAWIPKQYSGSYGTNGFYLEFSDNSDITAATLGKDSSGNGNNWTPANLSVSSGVDNDSVTDTPTNNYSTLNPLDMLGGDLKQANLYYAGPYTAAGVSQNGHGTRSTIKVPASGKWYVEAANITYTGAGNSCMLGFTSSEQAISATAFSGTLTPWLGVDASVFNGTIRMSTNGAGSSTGTGTVLFPNPTALVSGDIVNLAIDFDNGKLWVGKNGTWYNSGDPAAGTNATTTFTVGSKPWAFWAEYVASSNNVNRSSPRVNFGQQGFEYTQPSGFLAMNTANLPEPTIKNGTEYFNTVLYAGTGVSNPRTDVGFQPDWVWIKKRNGSENHEIQDSVRGATKRLNLPGTAAETTVAGSISSFDATGFTVVDAGTTNESGFNYVAWNWKESVDAGFDIVTDVGTGAAKTVSHNLGVAPKMIIRKSRTSSTGHWYVYHYEAGASKAGILQLPNSFAASTAWNSTAPTSSVFSVGSNVDENKLNDNYISYLFAEIEGFSKFGSYVGASHATNQAPYVHCGFRPAFLMVKNITDSSTSWVIHDAKRDPDNGLVEWLLADSSAAEATLGTSVFNFAANGFFARDNYGSYWSAAGKEYIFMAFAETPFKYANAR